MRRKEREIIDPAIIDGIIARSDVCRLALVDGNKPYIVAMNFGFKRGEPPVIYFHCATSGRKMDIIESNNNACFLIDTDHKLVAGDRACDFTMKYSSVAGTGTISVVSSPEERETGLNTIMKHYSGKDDYSFNPETMARTTILKLEISEISCKVVK